MADQAQNKIFSGARAVVSVNGRPVGTFNTISYGMTYDTQPAFILGRFSAAEIDYTAQEPVSVNCSGWRILDHGPHADSGLPKLQDLLNAGEVTLTVHDRQSNRIIAKIEGCRPTSYSTTISARQLVEISVTFVGLVISDETASNTEKLDGDDKASTLP